MLNNIVQSVDGTNYTTAIAAGSVETETFPGLAWDGRGCIKTIMIRSADKRAWGVEFMDADSNILYFHKFTTDDAVTYSGENFYCASVDFPILRSTTTPTVTVGVRNNSAEAKTASATFVLSLAVSK